MALIVFSPHWKGKRAMTVPADKARTIYDNWHNPTGDLSEEQLDMLKCIENIYMADSPSYGSEPVRMAVRPLGDENDTRHEQQGFQDIFIDKNGEADTWQHETQGKTAAAGKD